MKKIGIITWFNDYNYGTKLQAYALQEYLNKLGCDASIINYSIVNNNILSKNPNRSLYKKVYGRTSWELLKQYNKLYHTEIAKRNRKLDEFTVKYCKFSDKIKDINDFIKICNEYDLLISGSDQIWNPDWYNPIYYADFAEIKTAKIAYAPSIGTDLIREDMQDCISKSLKGFRKIGMREETGCRLIKELFGIDSFKVVDPTLLLDREKWIPFVRKENNGVPYAFCYLLSDNPYHWKAIKRFIKKENIDIKIIPKEGFSYLYANKFEYSASIEDFLSLIYYSKYVITDSFHACVFSTIFNKEFIPIERFSSACISSQNSRIHDFLKMICSEEILQQYDVRTLTYKPINWSIVKKSLEEQIMISKKFLDESIYS